METVTSTTNLGLGRGWKGLRNTDRRRGRRSKSCFLWTVVVALWLFLTIAATPARAQGGQEETLHYQIQEESDVGAFVGNVARDSQLYSRFTQEEFQQLQYSISSRTAKFSIDESTSTIRTGQVLDREVECQNDSPDTLCQLEFDVGVYRWDDGLEIYDLLMIVHVTVELEDVNDNAPQFPKQVVHLSVPESAPEGHVLLTSGAVDSDTGDNTIKGYTLEPDHGAFRLQVMRSVDGLSSDLGIVLKQRLDRERQSVYRMQVIATDGGFPERSGSVNITVNVQDVNDNPPTFSQDVFNISVTEDSPPNVPILRLVASDPDSSHNGALTFGFSPRTSHKILDQFAVDPNSGDIILTKMLDFEKDEKLQFVVVARDHGSPEQSTQAAVIVNVVDVNDNAPQIDITLPPGGTVKAESIEVGSFIAHVSLSDADGGRNGQIDCSVTNSHFRLEKFSDLSYIFKILLESRLDYEVARQEVVNVTCTDRGTPPRSNSSSFTIHVRDENDNAPIFSKPEYHISVKENMDPGVFDFKVIAMDPDSNNNGNVTYSLVDNPDSAFSIDSVSGSLRAMMRFDRETKSSYRLVIQARDRGVPSMSSTALVHVQVEDVNDSPTRFADAHFEFYVEEELPKGSVVDTLRVVDLDNVPSQQLQFSFFQEQLAPPEFHVDVYTGQITTTRPLDREGGAAVYDFKVFVVDAENVLFNDTASVTVRVTDVNDHAPNITFPNVANHTVRLPHTVPAGTIIAKVTAHDLDQGQNGSLTYGLEEGDSQDIFFMNAVNGEVILTRRLDTRDVSTYHLRVSVQDGGRAGVQKTAVSSLTVVITSSNSTGLFSAGGKSDHNVAIVITLVCVTLALALAVLATICIIRRIDRERKQHHSAKAEEQNIYKQETLPPPGAVVAVGEEKTPTMENYENEIEKLKRKIKRELSFVSDEDMLESGSESHHNGTPATSSFSTFKKSSSSPGSTLDRKMMSSPQASSSVLHSSGGGSSSASPSDPHHHHTHPHHNYGGAGVGGAGGGVKRVHYLDRARELNQRDNRPTSPAVSPTGPLNSMGQATFSLGQQHRAGLMVRTEGEDAGSHTSGSTSDSGRGGSSEDDVHSHACLGSDSGEDLRMQQQQHQHPNNPRSGGYIGNPSMSTFRAGGNSNNNQQQRGMSSHHHTHQQQQYNNSNSGNNNSNSPHASNTSLNSPLSSASPRSYLQSHHGQPSSYSRNISFSDDSVTANTTVDCPPHQDSRKKSSLSLASSSLPPQQEENEDGTRSPPRGILSKDGSGSGRYGRSSAKAPSSSSSKTLGKSPVSSASSRPLLYGGRHQQQPPHQHQQSSGSQYHRQSPPLPIPPDMSPLESRPGDDVYGTSLRGKVVSFSLAGDSYQMTPGRRVGSSTRLESSVSGLLPPPPPQQSASSGVEEVGSGGSHLYVNQTGHSSLGQPYSLADMNDVLSSRDESRGGGGGGRFLGGGGGGDVGGTHDDDDRTTTTSGSYTINADDLCNEIDHLFFNDAVV